MSLFDNLSQQLQIPLELSPIVLDIFKEGLSRYGSRTWSSMIVKRLEDACGSELRAPDFPVELIDDEPEGPGAEELIERRGT